MRQHIQHVFALKKEGNTYKKETLMIIRQNSIHAKKGREIPTVCTNNSKIQYTKNVIGPPKYI